MSLQRWEPFREMIALKNTMDRLFDDSFVRPSVYLQDSSPVMPLDIYQTQNDVVVKASLPGFKPDDVNISITGDVLSIKGEHKEEQEVKEENYWLKERRRGSFNRSITLPLEVVSDKAEASFENGVLTLILPKAEEVKPKQIKVKAHPAIEVGKE